MKIEILMLLVSLVGLEAYCVSWLDGLKCTVYSIKKGEPLSISRPHNKLVLEKAKGSLEKVTFKELQDVQKLTLDSNEIKEMEDGTLCSLKNLQTLRIEYNNVFPKLSHKSMGVCEKLLEFEYKKSMRSDYKFLDYFEIDVFKSMKNVESIQLTKFVFKKFDKALLEGLENLKKFTIMLSVLEEIDDDAFCAPNLELLHLDVNTDIFSRRLFNTCYTVKNLAITSNLKNVFKEDTLQSMTNLTEIFFEVNLVSVSKNLFANLFKLNSIILGACHIAYIEDDAFKDQTNLQELTINENPINKLDGNFYKPLINLKKLNLVYNALTGIENIKHLPNLRVLDISNNEIKDFNTTTLKINLPRLHTLRIYNFVSRKALKCEREKAIQKELRNKVEIQGMFSSSKPCSGE